jgi:hypothetical protein
MLISINVPESLLNFRLSSATEVITNVRDRRQIYEENVTAE